MRSRCLSILFVLSTLLMAACTQGTPTPAPVPTSSGASIPRPSPSALIPATVTTDPGPPPATIDSMTTVAVETAPGWVQYESINEIRDLAFAPDGGLWVSTASGLVRWDLDTGTYTRYPLPAIRLAVAPDGTLWLDTEYGLCQFDGSTCELSPDMPGIMADQVYALAVTPAGDLWVGGGLGASRFDGTSWTSYPFGGGVHGLDVSDDGEVWAATPDGVARYREAEDGWAFYAQEQGLPNPLIQAVGAGPGGQGWAYVAWEGLYRFDGEEWLPLESPPGGDVRDIAFAADGTPWVGTVGGSHYPGGALSYWNGDGWTDVSSTTGLISFLAIAPGPGVVAASTNLGLGIYGNGEWRMLKDGPISSRVRSVAVTPDGAAWFAFGDQSLSSNGSGLSQFDGQEWQYHLGDAEVGALAVAPDGSLWAGAGCDIQRFDGAAWETLARCEHELPVGYILDIEFASDGSVWVASGLNLVRFDGQAWIPHDKLVHSVVAAPDGSIWVNGWDGSRGSQYVARFDGDEWTTYGTADSFAGAFAVSAVTPDGRVWGIVPEHGLAAFDGLAAPDGQTWTDGASWTFHAPPEGFPFNGGPGPVLAPDGALWVRSQHRVARFDPAVAEQDSPGAAWTVYEHGLESRGLGGIAFGPGGEIWFGATRFQPALAESRPAAP